MITGVFSFGSYRRLFFAALNMRENPVPGRLDPFNDQFRVFCLQESRKAFCLSFGAGRIFCGLIC